MSYQKDKERYFMPPPAVQEVRFPAQDALWVDVSLQPAVPRIPKASGVGPEGWFAYGLLNSLFDQADETLAWVDQQQMLVTCIGNELFVIGVIVGIGEDLISSIEALLSLVRELVLVEFYRHLVRYDRGGDFGALVSPIGFMVDRMGFRTAVTDAYHDLVDLIEFCGEVLSDPSIMMDAIAKQAKPEYDTFIRLWNEPTLSSRFEAGRIFATVVLVVIDLVFFVKGAVKVTAKLPNMLRGFKKVSAKQWRALKPKANTARDVGGEVGEGGKRGGAESSNRVEAVEGDAGAVGTTRDESVVSETPKSILDDIVDEANLASAPGGNITDAQRLSLRQNLPVVQRRSPNQNKVLRAEFEKNQSLLMQQWTEATDRPWPMREVDGVLKPATPHHIIPLESGGSNKWWNLMPTFGRLPNHSLPGVPGPHAKGGVLRDTIQRGPKALPPGVQTDLRGTRR